MLIAMISEFVADQDGIDERILALRCLSIRRRNWRLLDILHLSEMCIQFCDGFYTRLDGMPLS